MLHLIDILQKVACELYGYSGLDGAGAIEELMAAHEHDINVAITDNVEASELFFLERYGNGETIYFKLNDYEDGKLIAADLHQFFNGMIPDISKYTGNFIDPSRQLYLFLHVHRHSVVDPVQLC